MTGCLIEWGLTWEMKPGKAGRFRRGTNLNCLDGLDGWYWVASCSVVIWWPQSWVIRMSPFFPKTWTSFCVTSLPFSFSPVPCIPCHTWLCIWNGDPGCAVHSCQWKTSIHCTQLPSCNETFFRWTMIVSMLPPSFKHQRKNDFGPMLAYTLEHLNSSLVCSPLRLTMVQVVPFSYNQ